MKYFKSVGGDVYAFESDGSQDHAIPDGLVSITNAEADAIRFPPVPAPTAALLLSAVDAERVRRWRAGFPLVIGSVTKWFHSDVFSLTQHLGLKDKARDLLAAGGVMSDNIVIGGQPVAWATMDGSQVTITAQIAFDLVTAAGVQQALVFAASEAHRLAIAASPDPASYDVSVGWPAVFGE